MAFNTQGTTIAIYDATTSPITNNPVGSIVSFSGPGGSAAVIPASNLSSTAVEKVMGLPDEGQFTMEVQLDNGDTNGQVALRTARANRTLLGVRITFSDSPQATATFSCYCTQFQVAGGTDALTTASITLEITGAITWA